MPSSVGPNTFGEENLVFGYDLGDVRNSYKGEPTVNVIANPEPLSGWSISNFAGSSATGTYETENGIPHLKFTNIVTGTSNPDYPRVTGGFFTSTITDGFSVSFEAKGTPGTNLYLSIYSAGSTKIINQAVLTSEWTRYTFENKSTGFTLDRPYIAFYETVAGAVKYIRRIQVEQKTHATPFTTGTRSATQGLLDLTGNSTIDLTNVSFDSNGRMVFDGSNDLVNLGSYLHSLNTSLMSIELVFKTNISTAGSQILLGWHENETAHGYICTGNFTGHWSNESISFYNEGSGTTALSFSYTNGHGFLNDTKYHHAVFILQTGGYKIYVDGLEVAVNPSFRNGSQATVMPSNLFGYGSTPSVVVGAGSNPSTHLNGEVPIVKIYNRALTASEVKSNFNAIKGRFSIL